MCGPTAALVSAEVLPASVAEPALHPLQGAARVATSSMGHLPIWVRVKIKPPGSDHRV